MPNVGDLIELDITNVAHGGVFVARHPDPGSDAIGRGGRVVFVTDTLPGERVLARVTDTGKSSFWRADTVRVLQASPERQRQIWAAASIDCDPVERAGGAEFGHIQLATQCRLKSVVLTDALRRFGGLRPDELAALVAESSGGSGCSGGSGPAASVGETDRAAPAVTSIPVAELVPVLPAPGESEDGTRWRTRVSVHVDQNGMIGPYAARSHTVIPVPDLPLATAAIERAFQELSGVEPGVRSRRVDLVQAADGEVRHSGEQTVLERVHDREFRVASSGFWQVHRSAAAALTAALWAALTPTAQPPPAGAATVAGMAAAELAAQAAAEPGAIHLDLYGGVGLFAATLEEATDPRSAIISVEADAGASAHAQHNLHRAEAIAGRVDRWLAHWDRNASAGERAQASRGVTVLDPPRAGAGKKVVRAIAGFGSRAVVYIACDPVALARDVGLFRELGYQLVHVHAYDLFPNTHHLETVATLVRVDKVAL